MRWNHDNVDWIHSCSGSIDGVKPIQTRVGHLVHTAPRSPTNDDPFLVAWIIRGNWHFASLDGLESLLADGSHLGHDSFILACAFLVRAWQFAKNQSPNIRSRFRAEKYSIVSSSALACSPPCTACEHEYRGCFDTQSIQHTLTASGKDVDI